MGNWSEDEKLNAKKEGRLQKLELIVQKQQQKIKDFELLLKNLQDQIDWLKRRRNS